MKEQAHINKIADKFSNASEPGLAEKVAFDTFPISQSAFHFGVAYFIRDMKVRHRRAKLGFLWGIAPIILLSTMAILLAEEYRSDTFIASDMPYPIFVLSGLIGWNIFRDGVYLPVQMCRRARTFLRFIVCPHGGILVAAGCYALFNLALSAVLIAGQLIYFEWPISWTIVALPFAILLLMAMGMVFGMVLAPISLVYLDIRYALPFVFMAMMFLSPVFYQSTPDTTLGLLMQGNPLTYTLSFFRDSLLTGTIREINILTAIVIGTAMLFYVSYRFYQRAIKMAIQHI